MTNHTAPADDCLDDFDLLPREERDRLFDEVLRDDDDEDDAAGDPLAGLDARQLMADLMRGLMREVRQLRRRVRALERQARPRLAERLSRPG